MPDLPKTNDEVLIALSTKAKETGQDSFFVRVERRGQAGIPESLTYCEEAEIVHLAKPEEWLPSLFGGGNFILSCYHASDRTQPLGRLLFNFKGAPSAGNWPILDGTWNGPKKVSRPSQPEQVGTVFAEGDAAPPPRGSRLPWLTTAAPQQGPSEVAKVLEVLRAEQQAAALQRVKDEARLERLLEKVNQPAQKLDVAALLTAAAPLVGLFLSSQKEARVEMAKLTAAQGEAMREVLKTMQQQPKVDPMIEKILDRQQKMIDKMAEAGGGSESEALQQSMAVMQQMYAFTTKAIAVAAEAQLGGKDDGGILPFFREATKAIESFFTARANGASGTFRPPNQPALAAGQPAQPTVPAPQQLVPAGQTATDQLFAAILQHADVNAVVQRIVELWNTEEPSFMGEMSRYGDDIIALATARLGPVSDKGGLWVVQPANQLYLRTVLQGLEAAGVVQTSQQDGEPREATSEGAAQPAAPAPNAPAPVVEITKPTKKRKAAEKRV